MGRDQSGRDGISACAGRVGYRDRGNCAIPRHRDPRLSGYSLALVVKHSTFPRMNHLRKLGLASFFFLGLGLLSGALPRSVHHKSLLI
jgi:hypothetical protein